MCVIAIGKYSTLSKYAYTVLEMDNWECASWLTLTVE